MPKTPLPPYDPNKPILRGHVVDAAKAAWNEKNKTVHAELWSKVLSLTGGHPLEAVDLDLLDSLSEEAMNYMKGLLEHKAAMARIETPKKKRKNGKSKRGKQTQ